MKPVKRPPTPPWINDSHPEYWFPVGVAARFYFRKSITTVKRMIKAKTLDDAGILSYWDGTRWFVRIPALAGTRFNRIAHNNRSVA